MEQTNELQIQPGLVLDLLDQTHPALSSTNDMPLVETKPDSTPEKVEEAAPEEAEPAAESATVDTEETPGATEEPKKTPKGVQKRLDELTRQREEANRRADAEREEVKRLQRLLEDRKPVIEEVTEAKPSRADYATDDAFESALISYAEQKAVSAAERKMQSMLHEQKRLEAQNSARDAYISREKNVRDKYADFSEVAERPDVVLPMPVVDAILKQDDGPELRYYFGKNPAEAKKFLEMTINGEPDVSRQLYELGRISARLSEKPRPISNAPAPLKPVKAGETTHSKSLQEMSMEEYIAARKARH